MKPAEREPAPPSHERYTLDGDAAVEARIARDQALIAESVRELTAPPQFRALVLMGGYGRGEGGYRLGESGPEPYNDYDFFVVVRGLGRRAREGLQRRLAVRASALERDIGIEVDFALLPEERLRASEFSLINAEMLWGHRVISGDPTVLDAMPAMPFSELPLGEFTRLMLNRGALLLMNQQRLASGGVLDAQGQEVFFKYLFKAVLACGDARLAGSRRYHPSYVAKLERLRSMEPELGTFFLDLYGHAWQSKFHPDYTRYLGESPAEWQQGVVGVWLETLAWLEAIRTGRRIDDWVHYCSPALGKGQGQGLWPGLRNLVITARDFGPVELARRPRWSLRYPRERVISVLPRLLAPTGERPAAEICAPLALPAGATWAQVGAQFLALWRRYA
jgi:hypothetical protein